MSWLSEAWSDLTGSTVTSQVDTLFGGTGIVENALQVVQGDDWFSGGGGGGAADSFSGSSIDVGSAEPIYGGMGMVAAAGGGLVSLAAKLAGSFGLRGSTFIINGIKGRMDQLWPLVRKYGGTAVAGALGMSAAGLADLLMQAPTTKRRRARGISAANIRTTRRVVRFTNQMARDIGCVSRPRAGPRGGGRHRH